MNAQRIFWGQGPFMPVSLVCGNAQKPVEALSLLPPVQGFGSVLKVIPTAHGPVCLWSPAASLPFSTALHLPQPFSLHFYVLCRTINLPLKTLCV